MYILSCWVSGDGGLFAARFVFSSLTASSLCLWEMLQKVMFLNWWRCILRGRHVMWAFSSVEYDMGRVECGVGRVKWGVWSVKCEVWSVKCLLGTVVCGVWSAKCGLWNSAGKRFVQSWEYKVALRVAWCKVCSTKYHCEVFQMCQARVSNKSIPQECQVRLWSKSAQGRVSSKNLLQEFPAWVFNKSVKPPCQARVSPKIVLKACGGRVSSETVRQECFTRVSQKSVKQECSARVAFDAIQHLLFAFLCSLGTLLLREFLNMHTGILQPTCSPM